jgi:hypothetical protein
MVVISGSSCVSREGCGSRRVAEKTRRIELPAGGKARKFQARSALVTGVSSPQVIGDGETSSSTPGTGVVPEKKTGNSRDEWLPTEFTKEPDFIKDSLINLRASVQSVDQITGDLMDLRASR